MSEKVKVVAFKGEDKIELLDKTLDESGFLENLNSKHASSGKSKTDFSVVIKPNLMMFTHKEDPVATYTDPELIEHLVDLIRKQGFKNLKMVESQNCYGNWYLHREVLHVAQVAGFKPKAHGYEIVDMTENSVPHQYNGRWLNGKDDIIGKAWRDADYRISFAKNKTHIEDYYTLTLKNIYGTNPMQDKMYEYHAKREWYGVTFDMLKAFHPDFGIIDAFYSSDGPLGFKGTFTPKPTKMMLASPSSIAVDIVGSKMMGLDPKASVLMRLCLEEWKEPKIDFTGNVDSDYKHPGWLNVIPRANNLPYINALAASFTFRQMAERTPELLEILTQGIATIFEEDYLAFSIGGILTSGISGDEMDPAFPMKRWDELSTYIQNQTLKNIQDLLSDYKRQQSIRWEIGEFFHSLTTFFKRRSLSKQIDEAFKNWEKSFQ
ncbi:MAG: DUF362 domain-containing protein [Thaumarchaeota archaeon]|nr:DUF362 domain-containing protein [Nitrososphaerota archaeon]MCL5319002.1 DUF362 domain-containing protein [Nitrososphaerota archaeon]